MLSPTPSEDEGGGGGIGGGDDDNGKAVVFEHVVGNLHGEGRNWDCEEGILRDGEGCVVSVVVAWERGTGRLGWGERAGGYGGSGCVRMFIAGEEGSGDDGRLGGW